MPRFEHKSTPLGVYSLQRVNGTCLQLREFVQNIKKRFSYYVVFLRK